MSLDLCILASGSGGNCSVVRSPGGVFLVDCGIAPRVAAARLRGTGVRLSDISAVCVTHLDRDHFSPLFAEWLAESRAAVHCAAGCADQVAATAPAAVLVPFDTRPFQVVPGVTASAVRVAHDREGSHAFRFESGDVSIGYATDLGHVPGKLIDRFCGVDILALESNYDPQMQESSGRPWFVRQRITGGRGHLSNDQAFAAVVELLDRCRCAAKSPPQRLVLLHRSRQCNCPEVVKRTFANHPRLAGRVVLSEQHRRTEWISAGPARPGIGEQLLLKFEPA
jgi:phosphoribosyl 1,2-cyclic phosphodiesterase